MRIPRRSSPAMAAPSISLLILLAAAASAQNTNTDTTAATQQQNTDTNTATQQTTTAATTRTQATSATTATENTNTAKPTTLTNIPTLTSGDAAATSSTTEGTEAVTNAPSLTSTTGSMFKLTGVPTIAGYGIPTAVVPWTGGAAYMQRSQLPEGTVFIAVGSILAFMAAAVLAWRALVAWSLHRSVKRAAANALKPDPSMTKLAAPKTNYGGLGAMAGSTHSLDRLSAAPTRLTKTSHGAPPGTASGVARNSSLFFSPTAGAGNHSSTSAALLNTQSGNNRASTYLPAGYYASPSAAAPPSSAGGMTSLGAPSPSPLSSLNPAVRNGYRPQRDFGPSPPVSPSLPPARPSGDTPPSRRGLTGGYAGGHERMSQAGRADAGMYGQGGAMSASSLNLHVPGGNVNGGRAPSANLEELFDNHGNGPRERF
ncbi:hypothetical protein EJ08DRAFT_692956 [Tothia fuscella]|uniref:Uncharacterized protein n=1 Tax=Tothia fuscella TaxID=1048955 RepID=A0A9P4P0K8_9PEZI|nr:hypothetical protein EJ08DRAFT_692956 [Tothia fuscella]